MRVVSLFAGVGGMDLGFIMAGHKIVWANDNYFDAVETYKKNIGEHIVYGDIKNIPSDRIPDCDIVIGGFPCQGYSVANMKRNIRDSRNMLYLEMLRIVRDKKPKFFLAENVKGILSLGKGKVINSIISDFQKIGYEVKHCYLSAADYGVPQKRERVFILGTRRDLKISIKFPPIPTHTDPVTLFSNGLKPWVSVGEALKGIPEPEEAPNLPNHTCSKYKLRFNNYLGHRWVEPDRPAPTITARGDMRGGVVVIHHPGNHRRMTARELAAVQSFSLNFAFCGSRTSAYRQIANAVPPVLAFHIAKSFPN